MKIYSENESLNDKINELYNKIDAQDNMINQLIGEKRLLQQKIDKLKDYIVDELKEYEKGFENYKRYGIEDYTKGMAVAYKKCLEKLGDKEVNDNDFGIIPPKVLKDDTYYETLDCGDR